MICSICSKKNKGFTLIELLVVISIATVLMTVLVVQQNNWNDQLVVNIQAYETALLIRQAQLFALGVREDAVGSQADKFSVGYGVYFDQNITGEIVFFADRNGNKEYSTNEKVVSESKTFTKGVTIKDVCGNGGTCLFSGGGPLRRVNIVFFRPEPKANIKLLNNGGNSVDNPPVTITLKSPKGKTASIKVEANGQISFLQ